LEKRGKRARLVGHLSGQPLLVRSFSVLTGTDLALSSAKDHRDNRTRGGKKLAIEC